ncbi:acyltransferase family protein [Microbacterium sp. P05]|uniref:acyltransferase family protein n=1 Tax=Microbacterium sp. P05 TaxID=3366948 RepID=UPI003746DDBF
MSSGTAERHPAMAATAVVKKTTFRPDIQGLRALAVVAVILDHLIGWPLGGFVGVDVFFVISGFLITSLLLREYDKTGTISFTGFYARRAKRILPAATLVVVVTIAAGYVVFSSVRASQTVWDGIWATFFAANWRFAIQGTDYFNAEFAASPLQHYWSLSVEEQFYFVWPWLMLLIFIAAARWRPSKVRTTAHRAIGAAIAIITVASFAWAIWDTANNPTWAYFSTFTRTWELGIGALIAIGAGIFARIPNGLRPVLGWVGLLGIIASFFIVSDARGGFPAPWAALPVVATALVIVAGTGGAQRWVWPIMNPISSWVGDVSYSLYVWHFPVIIILAILMPTDAPYYVLCGVLILGFSTASYYLVEDPIRRYQSGQLRAAISGAAGRGAVSRIQLTGVSIIAVITIGLSAWALTPVRVVSAAPLWDPRDGNATAEATQPTTPAGELVGRIEASLTATSWPALDPALDQLGQAAAAPEWTSDSCLDVTPEKVDRCTYGTTESDLTAVVIGDSVSVSWMPGIRAALEPAGYSVRSLTYGQCPAAIIDVSGRGKDDSFTEECRAHNQWVRETLAELKPTLVIASSASNTIERVLTSGGEPPEQAFESALEESFAAAKLNGSRVVVLPPNPRGKGLVDCYTAVASPQDCVTDPPAQYLATVAAMKQAATSADVEFVETEGWFCARSLCPAFVGTTPMTFDGTHLTGKYSRELGPLLAPVLLTPPAT